MNCCVNCFADQGLQDIIESMSINKAVCDFCESEEVTVIDCDKLTDTFEQLFSCYVPEKMMYVTNPKPIMVYEHLLGYWPKLFNPSLSKKDIKQLVHHIGRNSIWIGGEFIDEPVSIVKELDSDGKFNSEWDTFAREIKEQNRFFIMNQLNLNDLQSYLERFSKTYPIGTRFYRARISNEPLTFEMLCKPPKDKTTPGRANPVGIPYLYISDKIETTLYETRVSLHESISVGTFVVHTSLNIISLKDIAHYGPFEIQDRGFDIEEFMEIRPYLLKLEEELSKPVRKQDVNLDYLPTQYLCEFIKSLGFDGVEYRSAMAEGGYNLAVFNDKNLECVTAKHYQVKGLKYDWK